MKVYGYLAALLLIGTVQAQEQVVPAQDPDALFRDSNPKLHANKQAAYHIYKDLLEAGHWELADKYLTERYLQHNPVIASGRDNLVKFMSKMRPKPLPITDKLTKYKTVAVVAQGDLVIVANAVEGKDPKTGKAFTITAFDMWRFKDGKADEHWDPVPPNGAPFPPPPEFPNIADVMGKQ